MPLVVALIACALTLLDPPSSPPPSIFKVPKDQFIVAIDVQPDAPRQLHVLTTKAAFRVKFGEPENAEVITLTPPPAGGSVGAFILPETPSHPVRYVFASWSSYELSFVTTYDAGGKQLRSVKVPFPNNGFRNIRRAWLGQGETEPLLLVMTMQEPDWFLIGVVSGEVTKIPARKVMSEDNTHLVGLEGGRQAIVSPSDNVITTRSPDGRLIGELKVSLGVDKYNLPMGFNVLRRLPHCDRLFIAEHWVGQDSTFNRECVIRINGAGIPVVFPEKVEPPANPGVLCVREHDPCVFVVTEFLNDPENQHRGRRIRVLRDGSQVADILDRLDVMDTMAGNFSLCPAQFADNALYLAGDIDVFRIPLAPSK